MAVSRKPTLVALAAALSLLAACEEGANPFAQFAGGSDGGAVSEGEETVSAGGQTIERDVEAPDVFEATDKGLWDGRPSLGGVWVAYPDVPSPERVIIRNTASGKEVVGALFRREREMPGPRIQVSSEAASELGMLAGQPADLYVVALKRERIEVAPPEPPASESVEGGTIESAPLDPAATAAAALEAVAAPAETPPAPRPAASPEPAPKPAEAATPAPASTQPSTAAPALAGGSYIQIGIFSVEQNARNAGESLRVAGIVPSVREQKSGEKSYWRVLVGPVTSASDRSALLEKVRDLGYADAYVINN